MRIAFLKRSPSLFAVLIRFWTGSHYTHAEMVLGDTSYIADTKLGTIKAENKPYPEGAWEFIDLASTSEQDVQCRTFLESELGCGYDWVGIVMTQVLGTGRQSKDKWFCSEECTAALQHSGFRLGGLSPHKVSPGKLFKYLKTKGPQ